MNARRLILTCKHAFVLFTTAGALLAACGDVRAQADAEQPLPYTQQRNLVYGEAFGAGLIMDLFIPTGRKNGLGIVDVVSGGWNSNRGKVRQHKRMKFYDLMCDKGYTVFAVRPGSLSKFSATEMVDHLKLATRWVKTHANEYYIDPERLGMTGASAGGHLACLTALTAEPAKDGNPGTAVKAVAVFFPPTDLQNYAGVAWDPRADDRRGRLLRRLAFPDGVDGLSDEQISSQIEQISPARRVTSQSHSPAFLFIHGDADPIVPLQQSELMVEALGKANVPARLIVKKGGQHGWGTLAEETRLMVDWLDKQLAAE